MKKEMKEIAGIALHSVARHGTDASCHQKRSIGYGRIVVKNKQTDTSDRFSWGAVLVCI